MGCLIVVATIANRSRRWVLLAGSFLTLASAWSQPLRAQDALPPTSDRNTIVVIGNRAIIVSLKDVPVESSYDEDAVASYGANSVGEVLDQVRQENGDEDPSFLVNGRPVRSPDDLASLPAEAITRIEVLPKGSATRVGGQPGQRAYNVVLRRSMKNVTLTASREEATEGGWSNTRGEAVFTYINGQDRLNLSVRGAQSSPLLESERDFIPRAETAPFSPLGNIIPAFGTEVDPLLSQLAGFPVCVVALGTGNTRPDLASLVTGANAVNPSGQSRYRTLRGESRPIDVNLTANKQLDEWLSLSVNGRLNWSTTENLSGLPSARFTVPMINPYSPFSRNVVIALNDPARPLTNRSEVQSQALSATLNGQRGAWHLAFTANWDHRDSTFLSQFTGALGPVATVGSETNPFAGGLAATIPVSERQSISSLSNTQLLLETQGPITDLWAGPLSGRTYMSVSWLNFSAEDTTGPRSLDRREVAARGGISLPLTSRQFGFLPMLGESQFDIDYGAADLGKFGTLTRRSLALNWQPIPWLRLVALDSREERAVAADLIAAPLVVTPNVPYFDPLTGQTVDVTTINGGSSNLADEDYRTRSIALTITPDKKRAVALNAEYVVNDTRNQVGALPLPSSAVVAAFPDRFIRDSGGELVTVDSRSINFARQRTEALRLGLRFAVPLDRRGALATGRPALRKNVRPLRLSFSANHSILLSSTAVIRAGLPEVDLLAGGAIGIGGGQVRDTSRANLALNRGGSGLRLDFTRRGSSKLVTGTPATPDLLKFDALATFDLRAFVDLGEVFPKAGLGRGTRLSLVLDNIGNQRQKVRNSSGEIPQAYQPVRRDPVGRTVMVELRIGL